MHQFDKVEMFSYVDPADAEAEHARLLEQEKAFLTDLELTFRVIDVAAGDLGSSASRKFDCEAWLPSQERWLELTSTSNCTDFQARRLGVRVRTPSGPRVAATLNGTLCAIGRTIAVLLEVHQRADGSVHVPKALRPYLGGRRRSCRREARCRLRPGRHAACGRTAPCRCARAKPSRRSRRPGRRS